MDIRNEARKHLLSFLLKVLDDSYTQSELENFSILMYQDVDLEEVRQVVSQAIQSIRKFGILKRKPLREEDRVWIERVASDLKSICIYE
ncbi:MAG: hypothetical protein QNL64_03020 [Porticoccus sp.]|jgi:hypothetical protein|tara:strand:+ start:7639 stop:7905 length:267 start_codon:yes stop_codon:yes gene_type:complete